MAKKSAIDRDHPADGLGAEDAGGLMSGFLADEEAFDRRALLRLCAWGVVAVGAVVVAVLVNHSSLKWRRDQLAALDLAQQSQRIQSVAKESQNEARRLASAIDTLNDDRDRLYSRMTAVEQGLGSMTGSISRQIAAAGSPAVTAPPPPMPPRVTPTPTAMAAPATVVASTAPVGPEPAEKPTVKPAPPATVAKAADDTAKALSATPPPVPTSITAPPPDAVAKSNAPDVTPSPVIVAAPPVEDADAVDPALSPSAVKRTEFGVDIGGASSVGGLRLLWRNLNRSKSGALLAALEPIIMVKEGSARAPGLQLRLVAGPLTDAAAAAKICAAIIENKRPCETTEFNGQRLAMKGDDVPAVAGAADRPGAAKPVLRRRPLIKRAAVEPQAAKPAPANPASFLNRRQPSANQTN